MRNLGRDGWEACAPGEFARLATRLRRRRRGREALRATVAVSLAVLVGLLLYHFRSQRPQEFHYAGISCSRVMALAQDYAAGRLSAAQREQVRKHVSECPHCKPLFKTMGIVTRFFPLWPEWRDVAVPDGSQVHPGKPPVFEGASAAVALLPSPSEPSRGW